MRQEEAVMQVTARRIVTEPEQSEGPRPFGKLLHDVAEGSVDSEGGYEAARLIRVIEEHALAYGRAAGQITVTLSFRMSMETGGRMDVVGEVKVKSPKPRRTAVMWVGKNGNLLPSDPRQLRLPGQEVPRAPQRDIDHEPQEGRDA